MKVQKVLEKLEELLAKWNLGQDDWVLAGDYAWRLQGYEFEPRKGHLNIFVDRKTLPWKVGELDETAIPPKNSEGFRQLKEFIKETKFGPHFLPLPVGKFKSHTIEKAVKQSQLYTLSNKRKIRIQKVSEAVKDRAIVLLEVGIQIWDEPKIKRWLEDFRRFKKFAEKKNDEEVIRTCNSVLKRCREVKKEIELKPKKEIPSEICQLIGNVAYAGRIIGKVKIVFTAEELVKFQEGNILVTPMTTPDFVIGIEKSAAIVTDKGGIGCHAAVISREFRKPCIIGTENATKVLEDGDLIEVDADKGIVRILEKAK